MVASWLVLHTVNNLNTCSDYKKTSLYVSKLKKKNIIGSKLNSLCMKSASFDFVTNNPWLIASHWHKGRPKLLLHRTLQDESRVMFLFSTCLEVFVSAIDRTGISKGVMSAHSSPQGVPPNPDRQRSTHILRRWELLTKGRRMLPSSSAKPVMYALATPARRSSGRKIDVLQE